MKTTLVIWMLMAGAALAGTNFVAYTTGDGVPRFIGGSCEYLVDRDKVVIGTNDFGNVDWAEWRVVNTVSDIPAAFTNISQVTVLETVLPLADEEKKNWERLVDRKLKAIVTGLVKTINLRLPAGQKITARELKAAIKEEL